MEKGRERREGGQSGDHPGQEEDGRGRSSDDEGEGGGQRTCRHNG